MKKLLFVWRVMLMFGLLASASALKGYFLGDNCCYQEDNCCVNEAGPLICGTWGIQVKGGIAPTLFTNRSEVFFTNPLLQNPVVSLFSGPKFSEVYRTPWLVGGEIDYALTENIQLFGEVNYRQAKTRNHCFRVNFAGQNILIRERLTPFKVIAGYLGARYFCDRWFDAISPFVGFKVGVAHHKQIDTSFEIAGIKLPCAPLYFKNTVVSGGGQLGFDACLWGDLKFMFAAEVVATASLRPNRNIVFAEALEGFGFVHRSQGGVGTEVSFPITFGLRYDF